MPIIPQHDEDYLKERGFDYQLKQVGAEVHLVIRNWAFPSAYNPQSADLLIRISAGYPLSQLDMFWTSPDLKLASGGWPQAAEVHETLDGRNWQRWSRHTQEWRAGVDNLRTFVAAVTMEINRGI
jgi:hypothetical protein